MRPYKIIQIPNGKSGISATLKLMSRLTNAAKITRPIRELAISIVAPIPHQNPIREIDAIHLWVQRNIRYVHDVRGVETLQPPIDTLRLGAGDCDDMSTLCASLIESIGYKTKFAAVGFNRRGLSHVLPLAFTGKKWLCMECTKPLQTGEVPKNITSVLEQYN